VRVRGETESVVVVWINCALILYAHYVVQLTSRKFLLGGGNFVIRGCWLRKRALRLRDAFTRASHRRLLAMLPFRSRLRDVSQ
jgi:hypothetical protein